MKKVQHGKSATWKKCSMQKMLHEKSATWKKKSRSQNPANICDGEL